MIGLLAPGTPGHGPGVLPAAAGPRGAVPGGEAGVTVGSDPGGPEAPSATVRGGAPGHKGTRRTGPWPAPPPGGTNFTDGHGQRPHKPPSDRDPFPKFTAYALSTVRVCPAPAAGATDAARPGLAAVRARSEAEVSKFIATLLPKFENDLFRTQSLWYPDFDRGSDRNGGGRGPEFPFD
eukprot:766427-Hanusia_phi.AAC.5